MNDNVKMIGGDESTLTGGNWSTLMGGDGSTLTGGDESTLTGGNGSTLTGGDESTLCWRIWDGKFYRLHTFYVGENGVLPNVAYKFVEGKLEAQASVENKIGECIGTLPDDGKTDAEVQKEFNEHNDAQTGEEE